MPATKPTAYEAFHNHADDCAILLDQLAQVIARRRQHLATHWGHTESMAEVRTRLIQTLAFISGLKEADIEATLAKLRKNG